MLRDVLARIPDKPPVVPLPQECADFLRQHKTPEDILCDLAASSYAFWLDIGPLSLVPMPQLIDQNDGVHECIENGFLVLAGARNFDPVAFDHRTRRMVFVAHELLWDDPPRQFAECLHATPFLYEGFWEAVAFDPSFPRDYWDAKKRWPDAHL
jgi:hypothetical protein